MAGTDWVCVDGNEAAARVTHRLSEVIAIYPITPASPAFLRHVRTVERELLAILDEHGYRSVTELRGSMSRRAMPDPAGFERADYARTLASWPFRPKSGEGRDERRTTA